MQAEPELARHAVTVMAALSLGFLCAFVVLRSREPDVLPRWNGPISWAWGITVACAALLIACTFVGVEWRRPAVIHTVMAGSKCATVGYLPPPGLWLLRMSVIVLPAIVLCSWIRLLWTARWRGYEPARHSHLALLGLALSGAGLLLCLVTYGPAIHKQ